MSDNEFFLIIALAGVTVAGLLGIAFLYDSRRRLRLRLPVLERDHSALADQLRERTEAEATRTAERDQARATVAQLRDDLARYATVADADAYARRVIAEADAKVDSIIKKGRQLAAKLRKIKESIAHHQSTEAALETNLKRLTNRVGLYQSLDSLQIAIAQAGEHQARQQEQLRSESQKLLAERERALTAIELKVTQQRRELGVIAEDAEMQEIGIFRPQFDYDDSELYREAIKGCVAEQKEMVKEGTACVCSEQWQVGGSVKEGKKMTDRNIKLMLRAINGECDAIVSKVKHANFETSLKKMNKAFDSIDKLGQTNAIAFSPVYRELKVRELTLVHERAVVRQEEKEREREIKEQMREEAKAQKELEQAQKSAEKEEQAKRDELERAKAELKTEMVAEHAEQNAKLAELVAKLESELSETIDRKAKAIARAQLTRSGHVYVLSNIGTMGQGVYKIGMTRRLEPLDRVNELGGASVPFPFDVHAMIYTEDAPALEAELHRRLADRRVNLVNLRREYFRVGLDEIREAVADLHGLVTFRLKPEAEQFYETQAIRQEQSESAPAVAIPA